MAVVEKVMSAVRKETGKKADESILEKVKRGRNRMERGAQKRNECLRFWRGDQHCFVNEENRLSYQPTTGSVNPGKGKPNHRVRLTRNLVLDVVAHEVSAATQRVPSYEVSPSTVDPEDISAARLAEKIALFGFDKWKVRDATVKAVTYAVVCGEGFVWPYFNNQIGTPLPPDSETGEVVGEGEICLRVFGPNEVFWEPGCRFEDSPWIVVEQARPLSQVYNLPNYKGGELHADASQSSIAGDRAKAPNSKMVVVTEYLERPTLQNSQGKRVIMANEKVIAPVEPYPCIDGAGRILDEPCLHKLAYFIDPDSDRDMGLVQHILDPQRTYNDAGNKAVEWKNLTLMPQLLAPIGSIETRRTDEPGAIVYYKPIGGQVPQWAPTPPIPQELFQIQERAEADIGRIAAQNEIPSQVEAGKAIAAFNERDAARRGDFIFNLADYHSRLMRHCLYLVQRHYSDPRLLKIKGSFGWETIPSFRGSDLCGQADIRVFPASIEPRTKQVMEQRIMNYAQLGWISPQAAMAAIQGGYAESLIDDYELDIQRANKVIQKIKAGPQAFLGEPLIPEKPPSWMPRKFDKIPIHKSVFEAWLKTEEYDSAPLEVQEAAELYYEALEFLEAQKAAQEMAAQTAQAEQLGMNNAAKEQGGKPLPSLPSVDGQQQS